MQLLQIGIGGFGNRWLNVVQANPAVEHCAFVENNAATIEQQVAAYGLDRTLIYPTLAEALAVVQPDAVLDVSPAMFHREHALTVLTAGIPMLMEKPLALTPQDAQAILDCANATGTLLMVGQDYRYHQPLQTLKHVLDDSDLGPVGAVNISFYRPPTPGGYRSALDHPLLFVLTIHHMDVLRWLFGGAPVTVLGAHSWNPPYSPWPGDACAALTLAVADGPVVTYDASWCAQGRTTSWDAHWRLECERGVITLVDDEVTVHTGDAQTVYPTVEMAREKQHYLLHEFQQALATGILPATVVQDNIHSINIIFDAIKAACIP